MKEYIIEFEIKGLLRKEFEDDDNVQVEAAKILTHLLDRHMVTLESIKFLKIGRRQIDA